MDDAILRGARAIFSAKNAKQPAGTIDLHGQQVKGAELLTSEELDKAKKQGTSTSQAMIQATWRAASHCHVTA